MHATTNSTQNSTQIVHIERMAYGASAIGHDANGKTLFVDKAAPGDLVEVSITEEKPSFARAQVVSLIEQSAQRAQNPPLCTQSCGACSWAHLNYDAQTLWKRNSVIDALVRIGRIDSTRAEELTLACIPSKRQWGYRNKLELAVQTDEQNRLLLGMFAEGSHTLAAISSCPLANKLIEKTPHALQGALRFAQGASSLGIFRIGVRGSVRTHDTEIALWTAPNSFPRAHVASTLQKSARYTSIVRVLASPGKARKVKKVEKLAGKGCWEERLSDLRFLTSAPSFFQVNTAQAETMIATVLNMLGDIDNLYVADLYAGGGTFSIPLARAGAQVVAVEVAKSSVNDLKRNAQLNNVWVDAVCGDAAQEITKLDQLDALVVDPPRAGLARSMIQAISAAKPQKIVYVSCNPSTLARDISLFEDASYTLLRVVPVDMFPQTYHVETIALLSR